MSVDTAGRRATVQILCHAVFVLIGLLLPALAATAQVQRPDLMDSARVDTSRSRPDSTAVTDTLAGHARFRQVGEPLGSVLAGPSDPDATVVSKRDLVWYRYYTLFDALHDYLPAYPLSQGGPGAVAAYSYAGTSANALSVSYNGRPLGAPGLGAYGLELYSTEFLERAEVLTGARAAVYGSGESLMAINLAQPRLSVYGSYVRLWYIQGPHNTTGADILYDRNVGERTNLSLGFRRLPSDGEYGHQGVSNTVVRGALTWNPSHALAISLTEIFSRDLRRLNGGLTPTSTSDPNLAELVDTTLTESTLRHDVTFSLRWLPGAHEWLDTARPSLQQGHSGDSTLRAHASPIDFGDTLTRVDAALYYTHADRSLLYGDQSTSDLVASAAFVDLFGVRGAAVLPLPFARLEATGNGELWNGRFRYQAGGLLDIHTSRDEQAGGSLLSLRPAVKLYNDGSSTALIVVGEAGLRLGELLTLRGTLRNTTRLVDPRNDTISLDTLRLFSYDRTAFLAEAGLELRRDSLALYAGGYFRRTTPVPGSPFSPYNILGGDVDLTIPYRFLVLHLRALGTLPPSGDERFPKLYTNGDLYGAWTLFRGNLNLRVGTTLEYQTSFAGAEYDPTSGDFLYPSTVTRPITTKYPNWGAYAVARFGQAYVRVEMRNILNAEYWTLYRYPIWGRSLYLGASWALFD